MSSVNIPVCVTETDLPRRVTHSEDNNRHDPDLL